MGLLDDLANGTTATRRTYTAPILPTRPKLPDWMTGLPSAEELEASWKKKAEAAKQAATDKETSTPQSGTGGSLLTDIANISLTSPNLDDIFSKYTASDRLAPPHINPSDVKTPQEWDAAKQQATSTQPVRRAYNDYLPLGVDPKSQDAQILNSGTFDPKDLNDPDSHISQIIRSRKAYDDVLNGDEPDIATAINKRINIPASQLVTPDPDQLAGAQTAIRNERLRNQGGLLAGISSLGEVPKVILSAGVQAANPFNLFSSIAPEQYEQAQETTEPQTAIGKMIAQAGGTGARAIEELGATSAALEPGMENMTPEEQGATVFGTQSLLSNVAPVISGQQSSGEALKQGLVSAAVGGAFPMVESAGATAKEAAGTVAGAATQTAGMAGVGAAQTQLEALQDNRDASNSEMTSSAIGMGLFGAANSIVHAIGGQESGNRAFDADGNPITNPRSGASGQYQITKKTFNATRDEYLGKKDNGTSYTYHELRNDPDLQEEWTQKNTAKNLQHWIDQGYSQSDAERATIIDHYGWNGAKRGDLDSERLAKKAPGGYPSPNDYADSTISRKEPVQQQTAQAQTSDASDENAAKKDEIDAAANEAATSPANDLPEPTPLQQQSGNYKKGHADVEGFDVSIENPAGSVRKGIASDGSPWETEMQDHYGYIKGTTSKDGDHLDAFIGPKPASGKVFVVDQIDLEDAAKPFDEHKVIFGATDADNARDIYKRNFSDDAEPRIGALTETTPDGLQKWIDNGNPREPFAESDVAKSGENVIVAPEENQAAQTEKPNEEVPSSSIGDQQNATQTGNEQGNDLGEYQDRNSGREAAEAGSGDRAALGAQGRSESQAKNQSGAPNGKGGEENLGAAQKPPEVSSPEDISRKLQSAFDLPKEQADAVSTIADARAETWAKENDGKSLYGKETSVITASGKIPARYAVREASDIETSHDPINNFKKNPDWNIADNSVPNTRDYTQTAEQGKVYAIAQKLNPEEIANTSPGVTEGTPVTDVNGIAAGGNGRSMGLKLAYMRGAEGEAYKQYLVKEAPTFGLDPDDVASMKHPVLVREMTNTDLPNMERSEGTRLVDDLNKSASQSLDPVAEAVKNSQRLDSGQIDRVISALGEHDSINDAVRRPGISKQLTQVMESAGVIDARTRPQFITDGKLNDKGADMLSDMLLARVMPDSEMLRTVPKSLKNRIVKAVPSLLQTVHSSIPDLSLRNDLGKAISYKMEMDDFVRDGKGTADDFKNQQDAFREPLSFNQDHIVRALSAEGKGSGKVFADLARDYSNLARQQISGAGQDAMFGGDEAKKPSAEDIMRKAAGQRPSELATSGTLMSGIVPQESLEKFGAVFKGLIGEKEPKIVEESRQMPADEFAVKKYYDTENQWMGEKAVQSLRADVEAAETQRKIQDSIKQRPNETNYDFRKRWQDIDKAIHIYLDTERNPEHFDKYYNDLSPEDKRIALLSKNLTFEQKNIAESIGQEYKEIGSMAKDEGLIQNVLDNYVNRTWQFEGKSGTDLNRKFGTSTRHNLERTLETVLEGQAKGYELGVKGASNNLALLKKELYNTLEDKKLIDIGSKLTFDSQPLFGEETGEKEGNPIFSTTRLDGYKQINHPNFTKWDFAGKLTDYAPEEIQGMQKGKKDIIVTPDGNVLRKQVIYAPEEIAKGLNNILGASKLKGVPGFDALTRFNAHVKATILQTSLFHHLAFTRNHLLSGKMDSFGDLSPFAAKNEGLEMIRHLQPEVELLVRNGLTLGGARDWEEDILREKSKLQQKLDQMGIARNTRDRIADWHEQHSASLFNRYGAGLKAISAVKEYHDMLGRHPELEPDERARMVASLTNDNFGGLNQQQLKRNPTLQHVFRIAALAPDWTESNIRMATKSFMRGTEGNLYRRVYGRALLRGIAATTTANLLLALSGDEKDKNGKSLPYWDAVAQKYQKAWDSGRLRWLMVDMTPLYHAFGGDESKRAYFSLVGHFIDPIKAMSNPVQFANAKSSVITKLGLQALTGQDWKGQQFTSINELFGGDHPGQLTKFAEGGAHPVTWQQMPSFAIDQVRQMLPIQLQNLAQTAEGETSHVTAFANAVGLGLYESKDKPHLSNAEELIQKLTPHISGQHETSEHSQERSKVIKLMRSDKSKGMAELKSGVARGLISDNDINFIDKESALSEFQSKFNLLSFPNAAKVYKEATPDERSQLRPGLFDKFDNIHESSKTASEMNDLYIKFKEVRDLPYVNK